MRFCLINAAERKTNMHDDVIANLHLRNVGEADLSKDAAEIDSTGTH